MQPFPKTEDENNNDKIIITATSVTMKMTMTTKVTSCHEMVIQVTGSEKRNATWLYVFLANDNYNNTYNTSNNCDKNNDDNI